MYLLSSETSALEISDSPYASAAHKSARFVRLFDPGGRIVAWSEITGVIGRACVFISALPGVFRFR